MNTLSQVPEKMQQILTTTADEAALLEKSKVHDAKIKALKRKANTSSRRHEILHINPIFFWYTILNVVGRKFDLHRLKQSLPNRVESKAT